MRIDEEELSNVTKSLTRSSAVGYPFAISLDIFSVSKRCEAFPDYDEFKGQSLVRSSTGGDSKKRKSVIAPNEEGKLFQRTSTELSGEKMKSCSLDKTSTTLSKTENTIRLSSEGKHLEDQKSREIGFSDRPIDVPDERFLAKVNISKSRTPVDAKTKTKTTTTGGQKSCNEAHRPVRFLYTKSEVRRDGFDQFSTNRTGQNPTSDKDPEQENVPSQNKPRNCREQQSICTNTDLHNVEVQGHCEAPSSCDLTLTSHRKNPILFPVLGQNKQTVQASALDGLLNVRKAADEGENVTNAVDMVTFKPLHGRSVAIHPRLLALNRDRLSIGSEGRRVEASAEFEIQCDTSGAQVTKRQAALYRDARLFHFSDLLRVIDFNR